ncbi:MAG: DDE-type integrase/transposase/recombinase [Pseudomonadota bacterium]
MEVASRRDVRVAQWERNYIWRAVDHEREVLESLVTKTQDKEAALKVLKKALEKHGRAGGGL